MSSHVSPETGYCIRFAFLRASSSLCQSWTGMASGVAARSSHKSSTSWSFSDGLRSKMELVVGFTYHTPGFVDYLSCHDHAVGRLPYCEGRPTRFHVTVGRKYLSYGTCDGHSQQPSIHCEARLLSYQSHYHLS